MCMWGWRGGGGGGGLRLILYNFTHCDDLIFLVVCLLWL